jgi:hypothetical protein
LKDIEKLLNSIFPLVEELLTKYGEFFPFASAINANGSISTIGTYDGDEQPLSDKVITDLKKGIRANKDDYKVIAIFYDISVLNPKTNIKTDAVAVFVETRNENTAYTFYYTYTLTSNKKLIFSDSWRNQEDKEIFIE